MALTLTAQAFADRIELDWNALSRADSYKLRRAPFGTTAYTTLVDKAGTAYIDRSVVSGTKYTYVVRALYLNGNVLAVSNQVSIRVPLASPALTGTAGAAEASLSWTAATGADSYTLQRATGAGTFAALATQAGLTYIDSTAVSGTAYRYRVRGTASGGADTGLWSNEVSVTPTAGVPVAPTLTGTAGDSKNSLAWNSVANAATYRIRRDGLLLQEVAGIAYIDDTAINGTTYQYTVRGVTSGGLLGSVSNPLDLTPVAAVAGQADVGWGASATGGAGGTVHFCSTYAQFKAALLLSGSRIIKLTGSAIFDANGDDFQVSNGDLTIDGSAWTGQMVDYSIKWRASNIIIREVAFRTGEGATSVLSTDRSAIRFLPPTGGTITDIVLDHCSFAWGTDTIGSWLNNTERVTVQYCLFGPAMYRSNIPSSPNGYGMSMTTAGTDPAFYPKHITFYRNFLNNCDERNLRGESGDWIEFINNGVYNAGLKPASGNMQHASYLGNMLKKGPESNWVGGANNGWWSQISGGVFNSFFADSLYFPVAGDTAAAAHANIGINRTGGTFVPDRSFGGSSKRSTPYATAPSNGATVAAASEALFATVVNQAGRTYQDNVDTLVKSQAIAGTSSGFYVGAGITGPHPFF